MRLSTTRYLLWIVFGLALLLVAGSDVQAAPLCQDADATLRIVNDSDQTICHALIFPVTASDWGDDWLGDSTIPPGETHSFDLPQGDYNILLADCEENVLLAKGSVVISDLYELHFTITDRCETLSREGMTLHHQTRYPEALEKLHSALACYRKAGDRSMECTTLSNIGIIHRRLRQYEEALDHYDQALIIAQETGNHPMEAITLNNIGFTYTFLEQYTDALDYFQRALTIAQGIGNSFLEATILHNIGVAYDGLEQYQDAVEYYEQALTIRRQIDDYAGEGESLTNIGWIHFSLEQHQEATTYFQQALSLIKEIDHRTIEWTERAQAGLGVSYYAQGDYEQARITLRDLLDDYPDGEYADLARRIIQRIDSGEIPTSPPEADDRCASLVQEGDKLYRQAQYMQALQKYQSALTCYREADDRAGESTTLNLIAKSYKNLEQYEEALDYYEQALGIQLEIEDRSLQSTTLNNMGLAYHSLGQYQKALDYYHRSSSPISSAKTGGNNKARALQNEQLHSTRTG